MIDPKQTDVGRGVIYQGNDFEEPAFGYISSFNERHVFVRYKPGRQPHATRREDLMWEYPLTHEGERG